MIAHDGSRRGTNVPIGWSRTVLIVSQSIDNAPFTLSRFVNFYIEMSILMTILCVAGVGFSRFDGARFTNLYCFPRQRRWYTMAL